MVNGHDKDKAGKVDIAIGIHMDKVVIHWREPTTFITFDAQNAFDFGEQMARCAHKARFGEDAPSDGSYLAQQVRSRITEDLRNRMITRAVLMMRSMVGQEKSPEYIAAQVVDTIFAEVG